MAAAHFLSDDLRQTEAAISDLLAGHSDDAFSLMVAMALSALVADVSMATQAFRAFEVCWWSDGIMTASQITNIRLAVPNMTNWV